MNDFFNSKRFFQIWIYTVSHSILLIRSINNKDRELDGFNIDIEFWGVGYIDLPDILNGVNIYEKTENIPEKYIKYSKSLGFKLFEISSEGKKFYVAAAGYRVGKNNWESENRILNPNLEYDEIIANS